ncbi:MarR family transcriptional regulator [Phenylobacterium sp. VNQ135]|jgi:MarR family transcriptional regulator for hemolysin|uniref:MarR family transcriptional regulator n=1 Tax=Phenylobacterium sp. VNQ135 TaxID=3400922 RepID=UPI001A337070|nr:MarR family transcriptional regulator [Phenylobacterium sp.]
MQRVHLTDPHSELSRRLAFIHRRWRARLDERLRRTGLTQSRWQLLLVLSKADGGLLQRELAERVGIEASTLVRQLDALQRDGLIFREAVAGDRRAKLVQLAPGAQPVLDHITEVADALREEILHGIPKDDLGTTVSVLRRISERLE